MDVGDSHTFTMSSSEDISWLSLDAATGLLTGAPEDAQVGVYNITFSVEDAAGERSVSDAINLTVQNVNDPVYVNDGQTSLFRSETGNSYTVLISDEDLADTYTFSSTNLPSWMSLDTSTGEITGTPSRADDGVYDIRITVQDAGGLSDTNTIQITSTSYEYSILGLEDDYFIGDSDRDWIETGSGSDDVYAGAGDDVVKVQGHGDVKVDTGLGDDRVVVEEGWSGTLLLKNGVGTNALDIEQTIRSMKLVNGTDLRPVLSSGDEVLIEDHYMLDNNGINTVSDAGFSTIIVDGFDGFSNPFPSYNLNLLHGSEASDIFKVGVLEGQHTKGDVVNTVFGEAGDDVFYTDGGFNKIIGGMGSDTFYISTSEQKTIILGDLHSDDLEANAIDPKSENLLSGNFGLNSSEAHYAPGSISDFQEFETSGGELLWNFEDPSVSSLVVNETVYNSASSTTYLDGRFEFNGFNSNQQEPSQINHIELGNGIKAVVWAVDIWKELDDGRWDSSYDLFYRILDTNSAQFLTNEVRLTDDFSSYYVSSLELNDEGGFNIIANSGDDSTEFTVDFDVGTDNSIPPITSQNNGFCDVVYLEWLRSEVSLSNPRDGYFRVEHAGTGSVIDIYDVENLYFGDGERKALTNGQILNSSSWTGPAEGMETFLMSTM